MITHSFSLRSSRARLLPVGLLIALVPGVAFADPITPACEVFSPGSTYTVDQPNTTLALNPACSYRRVRVWIKASNVTLDCQGATLHGMARRDGPLDYGVAFPADDKPQWDAVVISAQQGRLDNITVRNCNIQDYIRAIQTDGPEPTAAERVALSNNSTYQATDDALWARGIKTVLIENVNVLWSYEVGIYIHRWADYVTMNNVTVQRTGAPALYLSGRHQVVQNSFFGHTGYFDYNRDAGIRTQASEHSEREAIAIDGSSSNTIRYNRFEAASAGAIFLYKNCNEHASQHPNSPREGKEHSHSNSIYNNTFIGGTRGVWIASRQWANLKNMDCGDPIKTTVGTAKYYWDYAENTLVASNTFTGVRFGVIDEDSSARIHDNVFTGGGVFAIEVGSPGKTVTSSVVKYNVVEGTVPIRYWNTSDRPASSTNAYGSNVRTDGTLFNPSSYGNYSWSM